MSRNNQESSVQLPMSGRSVSPVEMLKAELRAADAGLESNYDLLRGVLEGSGDCIKILDLDGSLQFMSEGGKRVMEVEDFGKLWPDWCRKCRCTGSG